MTIEVLSHDYQNNVTCESLTEALKIAQFGADQSGREVFINIKDPAKRTLRSITVNPVQNVRL